jgi:hypothetical protein
MADGGGHLGFVFLAIVVGVAATALNPKEGVGLADLTAVG